MPHIGDAAITGGVVAVALGLVEVVKMLVARRNGIQQPVVIAELHADTRSNREALARIEHGQEKLVEALARIAADQSRTADALDRIESRWPA